MKIGILTLHSGLNEGAILQAYALSRHLSRHLPEADIEIIDFRYIQKIKAYGPLIDKRSITLFNFINNILPLSNQRLIADNHKELTGYIQHRCDVLVIGSDEVWKLKYSKVLLSRYLDQKSNMHPPFPNAFWPEEFHIPLIAYAPSIGRTDLTTIPDSHKKEMLKRISRFDLLSYRDEKTRDFFTCLEPSLARRSTFVPDPLFTLEIDDVPTVLDSLKNKLEKSGVDFSKKTCGVIVEFDTPNSADAIRFLKKNGYQIISLTMPCRHADIDLAHADLDPFEWMMSFTLFDLAISCRFHGCISCLRAGTPFIGIDEYEARTGQSKIHSLMSAFSLEAFYYNHYLHRSRSLEELCKTLISAEWPIKSIQHQMTVFKEIENTYAQKAASLLSL